MLALRDEKERVAQYEFDEEWLELFKARLVRSNINNEQRRRIVEEKRKKDEAKDDTRDLDRESDRRRDYDRHRSLRLSGDYVASNDWKRPYPSHLFKALDMINGLSQEYPNALNQKR